MLKSNLNSSDSQIAFGNFIVRLLQHNENTGIARTPEDALALATAALGGDARAARWSARSLRCWPTSTQNYRKIPTYWMRNISRQASQIKSYCLLKT